MSTIRVPPGRAGRLWVRHRLEVADRGATLLEHKLRALAEHQQQLADRALRSATEWTLRAREADTWLLRAAILNGQRGLRLATTNEPATVTVTWTTAMGVRYPAQASYLPPADLPDSPAIFAGAALVRAQQAHRVALEAAVRHAADDAATRTVTAEITLTRQRVRALRRHWIPQLAQTAARLELELEERERTEAVARRWAGTRQ